jgi:hypothetical protein
MGQDLHVARQISTLHMRQWVTRLRGPVQNVVGMLPERHLPETLDLLR